MPAALPSIYQLEVGAVPGGGRKVPVLDVPSGLAVERLGRPLGPAEAEGDLPPRQEVHVKKALVDRLRVVGRLRHQRHLPRRQGQGLEADLDGKLLEPGRNGQRRRPDFAAVAETEHVVVSRRGRGRQGQDKTHGREKSAGLHTPHLTPAAGRCHAGGTVTPSSLDESRPQFRARHTDNSPACRTSDTDLPLPDGRWRRVRAAAGSRRREPFSKAGGGDATSRAASERT